jgi:hypothetical protein
MRQQLLKESVKKAGGGETQGTPVPARVKVRWSKSDSSPYTRSVLLHNLSLVSRIYSFSELITGETGNLAFPFCFCSFLLNGNLNLKCDLNGVDS